MPLWLRKEIQEMSRSRHRLTTIAFLAVSIAILFAVSLMVGAVSIPLADIAHILTGQGEVKETWRFIILENRLPQAVTALFAGAALAVSGLLLQTTFRNPMPPSSLLHWQEHWLSPPSSCSFPCESKIPSCYSLWAS